MCLLVLAAAKVAGATPLEPLWQAKVKCWIGATTATVRSKGKKRDALGTLDVAVDCGPLSSPCL